jgi:hypothetical protein
MDSFNPIDTSTQIPPFRSRSTDPNKTIHFDIQLLQDPLKAESLVKYIPYILQKYLINIIYLQYYILIRYFYFRFYHLNSQILSKPISLIPGYMFVVTMETMFSLILSIAMKIIESVPKQKLVGNFSASGTIANKEISTALNFKLMIY